MTSRSDRAPRTMTVPVPGSFWATKVGDVVLVRVRSLHFEERGASVEVHGSSGDWPSFIPLLAEYADGKRIRLGVFLEHFESQWCKRSGVKPEASVSTAILGRAAVAQVPNDGTANA
jgi:hypothetical protein